MPLTFSDLLPCPFCGEPAEGDRNRSYCQFPSGQFGKAVAVYCTHCPADMTLCQEDYPGEENNALVDLLVRAWNSRVNH